MSERERMIAKWETGLYAVQELANEFGVSRPTVYLWISRAAAGLDLVDASSAPHTCPHKTDEELAARIVAAKREHPLYGPAKIIDLLELEEPGIKLPAPSAAARILNEHGLVARRRRTRKPPQTILHAHRTLGATESGEMMTVDYKGQTKLGTGAYCFPLTMADPVSRYIYAIAGHDSVKQSNAQPAMEAVFREYGVPQYVGSDNGGAFCCRQALGGLTKMSVWWIRIGITPVRIHPGCPWENGRHERMHKTLKAHTMRPPAATKRLLQVRFDRFKHEFNNIRPHESLDGGLPVRHLKRSPRAYPRRLLPLEYPAHAETRHVHKNGEINWNGDRLFVSEALAGQWIALEEIDDGIWSISFAHIELGRYDMRMKVIV